MHRFGSFVFLELTYQLVLSFLIHSKDKGEKEINSTISKIAALRFLFNGLPWAWFMVYYLSLPIQHHTIILLFERRK